MSAAELMSSFSKTFSSGSVSFTKAYGARPRALETYRRGRIAKQKSWEMFLFILFKKENLYQCSELILKLINSELTSFETCSIAVEYETAANDFGAILRRKSMKRAV